MSSKVEEPKLTLEQRNDLLCRGIFDRFDKDKSGFISKGNLKQIIQDDKTFRNVDVERILSKYGDDGKMSFEQFKFWWNSTYTTYNDDNIQGIMAELEAEDEEPPQPSPPRPLHEITKLKSEHKLEESRS